MALLTTKEAAAELSISVRQLQSFVSDGLIPYVNISRKGTFRRFDPADIAAFIESRKVTEKKVVIPSAKGPKFTGTPPSIGDSAFERAMRLATEKPKKK